MQSTFIYRGETTSPVNFKLFMKLLNILVERKSIFSFEDCSHSADQN
jgi:hypothetical protein